MIQELVQRFYVLALSIATIGGCLITGFVWFAALWLVGAIVGIGTPAFRVASTVVSILAVVAMIWFIWWLVMRLFPRLRRSAEDAAGKLMGGTRRREPPPRAPLAAATLDPTSRPSLAELDSRFGPSEPEPEVRDGPEQHRNG